MEAHMIFFEQKFGRSILVISSVFLLFSCTNTKITQSWADPGNKKTYSDFLIIGIGESQHNRRAYESYFVEELIVNGAEAEASYRLIKSSDEIERNTVLKAIEGLDIDGVLITHMVAVDEETVYRSGANYAYGAYAGYGGYGRSMYGYYPYVNGYVHSPGYYTTHESYTLETTLYDVVTEELVWTARSETFSPESVNEVIVDLTRLLINDLKDKGLIKKK